MSLLSILLPVLLLTATEVPIPTNTPTSVSQPPTLEEDLSRYHASEAASYKKVDELETQISNEEKQQLLLKGAIQALGIRVKARDEATAAANHTPTPVPTSAQPASE